MTRSYDVEKIKDKLGSLHEELEAYGDVDECISYLINIAQFARHKNIDFALDGLQRHYCTGSNPPPKFRTLFDTTIRATSSGYTALLSLALKVQDLAGSFLLLSEGGYPLAQGALLRSLHECCAGASYLNLLIAPKLEDLPRFAKNGDRVSLEGKISEIQEVLNNHFFGRALYKGSDVHVERFLKQFQKDESMGLEYREHRAVLVELMYYSPLWEIILAAVPKPGVQGKVGLAEERYAELSWFHEVKGGQVLAEPSSREASVFVQFIYDLLCQLVHPNEGSNIVLGLDVGAQSAVLFEHSRDMESLFTLYLKLFEFHCDVLLANILKALLALNKLERLAYVVGTGQKLQSWNKSGVGPDIVGHGIIGNAILVASRETESEFTQMLELVMAEYKGDGSDTFGASESVFYFILELLRQLHLRGYPIQISV